MCFTCLQNSDEQDFDSQMREKVRSKLKKRKVEEDDDGDETTKKPSEIRSVVCGHIFGRCGRCPGGEEVGGL